MRDRAAWPEGVRLVIESGPDNIGRYRYTLHVDGREERRHALLPLWATRPIYGRDVSFVEWLHSRGVDPDMLPSDSEEAVHIGQSVFPRMRTASEKGKQATLARRIQQKHELQRWYEAAVPARVIGRRPLDMERADDRAYVRAQRRRVSVLGQPTRREP